jgi:hypothetical protein
VGFVVSDPFPEPANLVLTAISCGGKPYLACKRRLRAIVEGGVDEQIFNYCAAAALAALFAASLVAVSGVARAVKELGGGTK